MNNRQWSHDEIMNSLLNGHHGCIASKYCNDCKKWVICNGSRDKGEIPCSNVSHTCCCMMLECPDCKSKLWLGIPSEANLQKKVDLHEDDSSNIAVKAIVAVMRKKISPPYLQPLSLLSICCDAELVWGLEYYTVANPELKHVSLAAICSKCRKFCCGFPLGHETTIKLKYEK